MYRREGTNCPVLHCCSLFISLVSSGRRTQTYSLGAGGRRRGTRTARSDEDLGDEDEDM